MAPNSIVARPVWVCSLPALAVFLTFLWFRRKRIQTDTGGGGEPPLAVASVKEEVFADVTEPQCSAESVEKVTVEPEIVNESQQEVTSTVPDEPDTLPEADVKESVEKTVEESVVVEKESETVATKESEAVAKKESEAVAVETAVEKTEPESTAAEEAVEELVAAEKAAEETTPAQEAEEALITAETATQSEAKPSPGSKWAKKKRGAKKEAAMESSLDEKLGSLKIGGEMEQTEEGASGKSAAETEGAAGNVGRDSANTSPSEVMLASPSCSGYSDTHSEGSSDSGKGCSDVLTPSPTPVSGNSLSGDLPCDLPTHCVYEFVIPQHLVGRLIGRNGSYISEIKENSHATVYIKRHPETTKLKICAVEGTQLDIDSALEMIRQKFPKKKYPNVTLEQLEPPPEPAVAPPVLPDNMQLYLVEGINNDVILSSLVSAGHFFLQQPTHPTFPALNRLNQCMAMCYVEPNLPHLPDTTQPGSLCAAPVLEGWYRAHVTDFPEGEWCEIKFVDYGGYLSIEKSQLRQIRADFVTLPFQASECFLAAVSPLGDEWSPEAKELVETLTLGKVLQAQIHGYTDHGIPLIFLYTVHENMVVSINEELVAHGLAEWLQPECELVPEEAATDEAYIQAHTQIVTETHPITA